MLVALSLNAGDVTVEQLFNVKTVTVSKEEVVHSRRYFGTVAADEGRVHEVSLRFGGYVGRVAVDRPYRYVKKGEKLFDIYSPELFLAASELVNTLQSTHKGLQESIVKKLRLLGIAESVISGIIKAKKVDEFIPVYAPAGGYVTQKNIVNGSSVKAGQLLYTLTDLDAVWVMARVYESDLAHIHEGMAARIRIDGRAGEYSATLERIYPDVDAKTRSVAVRLSVANPEHALFPGAFADVALLSAPKTMLLLPKTAVITKGDRHYVFVAGEYEGEYEPTPIQARRIERGRFEVLGGLEEGTSVVDNALFLFDSDAQINGLY
jgi:Cu(I)/Ag(I) efflux system membrane fusion protein